jgi:predicted nucleic acid-binding protein
MKVLVDTCIWSLAFRRKNEEQSEHVNKLEELIRDLKVQMIGVIRQELLSGIKLKAQFNLLKERLSYFPDLDLQVNDYELAAELFNTCRAQGIQGSNTDFLIAAISINHKLPIYTIDKDFNLFQEHIPILLF